LALPFRQLVVVVVAAAVVLAVAVAEAASDWQIAPPRASP
jgi:hypothetical protein